MKIVIAPNAFKGSVSAWEAALALDEGIKEVLSSVRTMKIPMADGGDGTLDSMLRAAGGRFVEKVVSGPLGEPVRARFGVLGDGSTAVIEMALASGLALVPARARNPMKASTFGTGQLIKAALDEGARRLVVGIGGSATNDGGAGMACALGAEFFDGHGRKIGPGGASLAYLARIGVSGLDPRVRDAEIIIASDVTNPLCGPEGASMVYGYQKGADDADVRLLDEALSNYARVIKKDLGLDLKDVPGAGAAGGLGAGLMAFLGAGMRSGVELVMEISGFRNALEGASLVITGEGKIDSQTGSGKAPGEVAKVCMGKKIPVIGVCGELGDGAEELYEKGFASFFPIVRGPCSVEYAMENAYYLLKDAGRRLAGIFSIKKHG